MGLKNGDLQVLGRDLHVHQNCGPGQQRLIDNTGMQCLLHQTSSVAKCTAESQWLYPRQVHDALLHARNARACRAVARGWEILDPYC